ncbi:uncharacterized protein G2W53_037115 [Senna tora]|uniref:Uncharacterized protein n=1 Tax=Senna tora TaxID=362788 RepID=A0A834SVB2_9FABA|nr:uncharacterized protein G2W53_037115 [Senna tora]
MAARAPRNPEPGPQAARLESFSL